MTPLEELEQAEHIVEGFDDAHLQLFCIWLTDHMRGRPSDKRRSPHEH
jgi:hypothetical protein